jgi:hypothetical protein
MNKENCKEVLHITTNNYSSQCVICGELPKSFQDAINHYLSKHNYKLLNTGTESAEASDGSFVHDTAVLLGK